ncbi:MAG: DUF4393 domain-containing protein [Rubrivivax sp.]|nr:MAG: DUF4393 domain-containing protein [Rubrivivax sp.]
MATGWIEVAQEALKVPGLLVEIYGDVARPGVRQVGKALETVIGLGNTILWPIALANERSRIALEKNLERYRDRMEAVPLDSVCNAPPEIGVPILEKLAYVQDEHLADLYVKLLASASQQGTLQHAHPSFVNVINNLSPDEAHFLKQFVTERSLPFVRPKAVLAEGGHSVLAEFIIPLKQIEGLAYPGNIAAYLSNLAGLGLLNIRGDIWLKDTNVYEDMENQCRGQFLKVIEDYTNLRGRELQFNHGLIERTSFGLKFIKACHKS